MHRAKDHGRPEYRHKYLELGRRSALEKKHQRASAEGKLLKKANAEAGEGEEKYIAHASAEATVAHRERHPREVIYSYCKCGDNKDQRARTLISERAEYLPK